MYCGGQGGQGGTTPGCLTPFGTDAPAGGAAGGGGGAQGYYTGHSSGAGGNGAVRVIWGGERSFPSDAAAMGTEDVN
jgi:hypothetical protein